MKKIIYLLMVTALVFTSACNPMDDIYDELDAEGTTPIAGEASFEMSDDDYDFLELSYGSFNSVDEAKEKIPSLLTNKYPVWGDESLVEVIYKLYDPIRIEDYTVTDSDYDALIDMGAIQGAHLSSDEDINAFFTYKYPQATEGSYVELTYNKLAGKIAYTLTNDDYSLVGNGSYNNFDIRTGKGEEDIEVRREKIEKILLNNFPDTPVNQQYLVSYQAFNNSYNTVTLEMLVQYDGTNYNMVTGTEYEFTDANNDLVAAELLETYPGPAGNLASYGTYDRRPSNDNYWSDDMLLEAINIVLMDVDPTAVEGTKYSVSIPTYMGSGQYPILTVLVQLNNGSYDKLPDTLVELTTLFALTSDWAEPFTLTEEDYTAMGQSYPNFSDEDLAWYRIGIYLGSKYPYAEADDMTAVSYDLYDGGLETEYVNFLFDGEKWNAIPSVVNQTLKFGQDGTSWVPDNTIKYTLTGADYALTGDDNYGNYYVKGMETDAAINDVVLPNLNIVLPVNFPGAEEGQKFNVFYNVYTGAGEVWNTKVILTDGEYVLQE